MAMTRYDYLIHGKDLYVTGKAAPASGTSWQQKAISDGYRLCDEFMKAGGKAYKLAVFLESGKTVEAWFANEPDSREPAPAMKAPKVKDLHAAKAAEMFNVPVDQVSPEQRRAGKIENFYKLYSPSLPSATSEAFNHRSSGKEAVLSHLNILRDRIKSTNDHKLIYRLVLKVETLSRRHGL